MCVCVHSLLSFLLLFFLLLSLTRKQSHWCRRRLRRRVVYTRKCEWKPVMTFWTWYRTRKKSRIRRRRRKKLGNITSCFFLLLFLFFFWERTASITLDAIAPTIAVVVVDKTENENERITFPIVDNGNTRPEINIPLVIVTDYNENIIVERNYFTRQQRENIELNFYVHGVEYWTVDKWRINSSKYMFYFWFWERQN